MIDWSDGDYSRTAVTLAPATERLLRAADVKAGDRVVDVGCGTGNAALAAAHRGARVTAIDPAAGLLELGRARAAAAGLVIDWQRGDASTAASSASRFDVALSVFGVIFAPDPEQTVHDLVRAVRPGGRLVITSWRDSGGIADAGRAVRQALTPPDAPPPAVAPPRWGDDDYVRALFAPHGVRLELAEETLTFTASSPAAWFDEQATFHPVWRFARRVLGADSPAWDALRKRSVDALSAANEDPDGLRLTSRYLVITAHC